MTNNSIETSEFISRFTEKFYNDKNTNDLNKLENNEDNKEDIIQYSSVIKTNKKSNITKNNIGEIMISQIPGISINTAQTLMEKFNNLNNLILLLKENSPTLENIKVKTKNGERKLNKNIIPILKEYLL